MIVSLPWPPSVLIPHAKGHWAPKAKATARYRETCWATALFCGVRKQAGSEVRATITMHPPDRRRRDRTNAESSFKAGIDGVAQALGIDDYHWRITWQHAEPVKGGLVKIELEVMA